MARDGATDTEMVADGDGVRVRVMGGDGVTLGVSDGDVMFSNEKPPTIPSSCVKANGGEITPRHCDPAGIVYTFHCTLVAVLYPQIAFSD